MFYLTELVRCCLYVLQQGYAQILFLLILVFCSEGKVLAQTRATWDSSLRNPQNDLCWKLIVKLNYSHWYKWIKNTDMSSDIKKRHVSPKGSIKLIWALNVSHLITLMRFYLNRLQMFNFLLLKCCVNLYPINCLSVFCVSDRQKHMFIYLESALSGSVFDALMLPVLPLCKSDNICPDMFLYYQS